MMPFNVAVNLCLDIQKIEAAFFQFHRCLESSVTFASLKREGISEYKDFSS